MFSQLTFGMLITFQSISGLFFSLFFAHNNEDLFFLRCVNFKIGSINIFLLQVVQFGKKCD